jgi:small glutamine-rich tetratricopeptide repeat-containing protein alpha
MSGKSNPTTRHLASSIVKFLQESQKNGTLDSEDAESIEVAVGIISEAFGLDTNVMDSANLLQVFEVYEKTREKLVLRPYSQKADNKKQESSSSNEVNIAEAERLKALGNSAVTRKEYPAAIDYYTQALAITPENKIYLSNRAAAYSQSAQHSLAAADALKAVELDPGYAKAWSRLGHARYALGDAKGSMEAYKTGLACEGGQTDVSPTLQNQINSR